MKSYGRTAATNLCQVCIFAMQGTGNVCWKEPCWWLRIVVSLSLVWDESRYYQLAILFWFYTCMFYFVRRWLGVKLRWIVWILIILVLYWRTLFSIVMYDRKRSTKDSYLSVWHLCWCLCWFCTMLTRLLDVLCAVFGAGKAHKINKGISERLKKQSTKTKSFLFFKKGIIDKEERYRNRLKARLTLIANTRIEKSC